MNPAIIALGKQFAKWAAKGLLSEGTASAVSQGLTVDLAKEIVANPEVYKRLVKMANRRIGVLRKEHMLRSSYAYQNLLAEMLRPQKRKTVSIFANAGKLYGNKHRSDYLGNALSLLKFLMAETSTPSGIHTVLQTKRLNFINQILSHTETTDEEYKLLKDALFSMTDAEFRRIAKLYEPVLNMGGATKAGYGSEESFNLIGSHILTRIKRIKSQSNSVTSKALVDTITKARKLQLMKDADPVDIGQLSVQEVGKFIGAGKVVPIPYQKVNIQPNEGDKIMKDILKKAMLKMI